MPAGHASPERRAAARKLAVGGDFGHNTLIRIGNSRPMLKLTFCLHRLPELTREQFQDYWLNRHAPLVHQHAAVLRIRRYVQLHSADDALVGGMRAVRGAPAPYDGVAELWFDSEEDYRAARRDPAARQAGAILLEDERKFIDLARSPLWLGEEHPIYERGPRKHT